MTKNKPSINDLSRQTQLGGTSCCTWSGLGETCWQCEPADWLYFNLTKTWVVFFFQSWLLHGRKLHSEETAAFPLPASSPQSSCCTPESFACTKIRTFDWDNPGSLCNTRPERAHQQRQPEQFLFFFRFFFLFLLPSLLLNSAAAAHRSLTPPSTARHYSALWQ